MPDHALDFSYQRPAPEALVGYDALTYCGSVRPPRDWLERCAELGVTVTLIMETTHERAQQGYTAGVYDAQFADARVDQVGYSRDGSMCYVVSDGNRGDPAWNGEKIAEYGEGVARTSLRPFFFYGNRYAVDSAVAGAWRVPGAALIAGPQLDGGWLPVTWGADPARDMLIQQSNTAPPIDGTDLNTVHHPYNGGVSPTPHKTRKANPMGYALAVGKRSNGVLENWGVIGHIPMVKFTQGTVNQFGVCEEALAWANPDKVTGETEIPIRGVPDGFIDQLSAIAHVGQIDPPIVPPADLTGASDAALTAELARRLAE